MRSKVREKAGRYWHEYTRMRTAIFLLLGILVIVLMGSFVPQQNTSDPTKVEAFLTSWPNLNVLFANLQLPLTQVFVSPVFYAHDDRRARRRVLQGVGDQVHEHALDPLYARRSSARNFGADLLHRRLQRIR